MIAVALITLLLHSLVSIWLERRDNFHILSVGTIHALYVEVYGGDIKEVNGQKIIDWGIVYPGSLVNRTFNVVSKSNIEATLIIKAVNWTLYNSENKTVRGPSDHIEYLNLLSPESNMTVLKPDETIRVTLYLNVTNSAEFINLVIRNNVTSFRFDIRIFLSGSV